MTTSLEEQACILVDLFARAAYVEKRLPDRYIRMMRINSGWPEYVYDADDLNDQQREPLRVRPSAKDIDHYERTIGWLKLLGMGNDERTVKGKKIIWARAYGYSYGRIGAAYAMERKRVERWYKQDIIILVKKLGNELAL